MEQYTLNTITQPQQIQMIEKSIPNHMLAACILDHITIVVLCKCNCGVSILHTHSLTCITQVISGTRFCV
jgi:hypothetical protein